MSRPTDTDYCPRRDAVARAAVDAYIPWLRSYQAIEQYVKDRQGGQLDLFVDPLVELNQRYNEWIGIRAAIRREKKRLGMSLEVPHGMNAERVHG